MSTIIDQHTSCLNHVIETDTRPGVEVGRRERQRQRDEGAGGDVKELPVLVSTMMDQQENSRLIGQTNSTWDGARPNGSRQASRVPAARWPVARAL